VLATDDELAMPLTVLCLTKERLNDRKAFLAAYGEAVAALDENPDAYRDLMVETIRIPGPLAGAFPVYDYTTSTLPSEDAVQDVQDWMIEKDLLSDRLAYDAVVAR
jgi:NitT/TauT family transport system substrate-binding protein